MLTKILLGAVLYLVLDPFLFALAPTLIRKAIESSRSRKRTVRKKVDDTPKQSIFSKGMKVVKFAFKNKMSEKSVFIGVYMLGLIVSAVTMGLGFYYVSIPVALIAPVAGVLLLSKKVKETMEEQERVYTRLVEIARSALGQTEQEVSKVVEVLEWGDRVTPKLLKFYVPTTFRSEGEKNFLRLLNQVFGTETAWVPDLKNGGWDYKKGVAQFYSVPPLPTMAPWKEEYAIGPEIAESFFPVALGVEGGLELTDKETGEKIHLLGYDVAGETKDKAKEFGYRADGSLMSAAPMVLCAGGTGGGKSINMYEKIKVWRPLT